MLIISRMFLLFPTYSDLEVDLESKENASMIYAALAVDEEVILDYCLYFTLFLY